jgi:nucleoid-associated protein YgaU
MRNLSEKIFDRIVSHHVSRRKVVSYAAVGIAGVAAAATIHYYTVQPGDTLSSIAARACGNASDWTGVYQQNADVVGGNPNMIYAGQRLQFKCNAAAIQTEITTTAAQPITPASSSGSSASTKSVYVAPAPQAPSGSFQACVISRESGGNSQVMNSSGHYGLYQFSASTWAAYGGNPSDFGNASVSEQNAVFDNAMATPNGASNWSPYDGC